VNEFVTLPLIRSPSFRTVRAGCAKALERLRKRHWHFTFGNRVTVGSAFGCCFEAQMVPKVA